MAGLVKQNPIMTQDHVQEFIGLLRSTAGERRRYFVMYNTGRGREKDRWRAAQRSTGGGGRPFTGTQWAWKKGWPSRWGWGQVAPGASKFQSKGTTCTKITLSWEGASVGEGVTKSRRQKWSPCCTWCLGQTKRRWGWGPASQRVEGQRALYIHVEPAMVWEEDQRDKCILHFHVESAMVLSKEQESEIVFMLHSKPCQN